MARIDDMLAVSSSGTSQDYKFTADQVIESILGRRVASRGTLTATYRTYTSPGSVYYTALLPDGTVLTARTTSGVATETGGLYGYDQNVVGLTDFIAIWDEGDPADYISEWIVVDT